MFKSLMNLGKDLVEIAAAPVEIAADLTRSVTKPMADAAKEVAKDVKEMTTDNGKKDDWG